MAVTSSHSFESRFDHMVRVAHAFHKTYQNVPFSLEYGGSSTETVYVTFTASAWSALSADKLDKICAEYGVEYNIIPLEGKLAVTIK